MELMMPALEESLNSMVFKAMPFCDCAILFISPSCSLITVSRRKANHKEPNSKGNPTMVTRAAAMPVHFSNPFCMCVDLDQRDEFKRPDLVEINASSITRVIELPSRQAPCPGRCLRSHWAAAGPNGSRSEAKGSRETKVAGHWLSSNPSLGTAG